MESLYVWSVSDEGYYLPGVTYADVELDKCYVENCQSMRTFGEEEGKLKLNQYCLQRKLALLPNELDADFA